MQLIWEAAGEGLLRHGILSLELMSASGCFLQADTSSVFDPGLKTQEKIHKKCLLNKLRLMNVVIGTVMTTVFSLKMNRNLTEAVESKYGLRNKRQALWLVL